MRGIVSLQFFVAAWHARNTGGTIKQRDLWRNLRETGGAYRATQRHADSAHRMAEFLTAIVKAATPKCPSIGRNTGLRRRKRGCQGPLHASLWQGDGRNTNRLLACFLCASISLLLAAASAIADTGQEPGRRRLAKMSYLDNGAIRLGVDLNLGGAITYLSRSGAEQNLVNSFDFGRQIQIRNQQDAPCQTILRMSRKAWFAKYSVPNN